MNFKGIANIHCILTREFERVSEIIDGTIRHWESAEKQKSNSAQSANVPRGLAAKGL